MSRLSWGVCADMAASMVRCPRSETTSARAGLLRTPFKLGNSHGCARRQSHKVAAYCLFIKQVNAHDA